MKYFNKDNMLKKILLTSCVLMISVILSLFLYWYKSYNDRVVPLENNTYFHKEGTKKHVDIKKVEGLTNILLVGIDGRTEEGRPLSDAIMILTIDGKHNDIKLTSIPRDTYCRIPGLRDQKINAAYSNGGKELLIDTIYENFDISLDKYVEINFEGFKSIVDYLEGIDVYLNNYEEVNELNRVMLLEISENPKYTNQKVKNIINKANLLLLRDEAGAPLIINNPYITEEEYNYLCEEVGLIEKEGMNHLNGSQLLAYSRMRHLYPDLSSRTERQRKVIELIMQKLSKTSIVNYYGLASEMLKHITTNIPLNEAVGLGAQVMEINNFDIKKMQIPPEQLSAGLRYPGYENLFVFLMDEENTTKALREFIFDDIEFDANNYPPFIYENSKYYVGLPENEENEDSDSQNDNLESNYPEENESENDLNIEDSEKDIENSIINTPNENIEQGSENKSKDENSSSQDNNKNANQNNVNYNDDSGKSEEIDNIETDTGQNSTTNNNQENKNAQNSISNNSEENNGNDVIIELD